MLAESGVFWLLRFGSGRSQWVGGLPWLVPALRCPLVVVCATVWLPPLWLSRRYAAVRADFALALSFFVFHPFRACTLMAHTKVRDFARNNTTSRCVGRLELRSVITCSFVFVFPWFAGGSGSPNMAVGAPPGTRAVTPPSPRASTTGKFSSTSGRYLDHSTAVGRMGATVRFGRCNNTFSTLSVL